MTLELKAILVNRAGKRGEPLPHLMIVDTRTGSTYVALDVRDLPRLWRPGATTRHEATIAIELHE